MVISQFRTSHQEWTKEGEPVKPEASRKDGGRLSPGRQQGRECEPILQRESTVMTSSSNVQIYVF